MLKMTVGMGSIDDYIPFVKAGVDEVFCGYTPDYMLDAFGMLPSVNRREVYYYPVQIGGFNELAILAKMREVYHVPVAITLNSLFYHPDQYALIGRMIEECLSLGFYRFIIADPFLLHYVYETKIAKRMDIHLSGEFGELNSYALAALPPAVKRVILPRQTALDTLPELIDDHEFEAFLLNEKCHFNGAYCQSLHCDEMRHLCLVNYRCEEILKTSDDPIYDDDLGLSGCGLCSLYRLARCGVSYFKIVSRGNDPEITLRDINAVKKAFVFVKEANGEKDYLHRLKKELFEAGCSHNCYYGNF